MPGSLLTLLSDFGLQDNYVGVMKGVIAQVNPDLVVVDLTHQIPPHDIAAARFSLMSAYADFPLGTVHIAVVDPGVGSARRAIAVRIAEGFLVGPDNGLFSGVLSQTSVVAAVELANSQYWYVPQPSATFHGRDIFAPVGAHLASGISLENLGPAIAPDSLVQLPLPICKHTEAGISGAIQAVDRFGNLITNIPGTWVAGKLWSIEIDRLRVVAAQTYSEQAVGELVALIGSHGWVEVAVNSGSAQSRFQQTKGLTGGLAGGLGNPVRVVFPSGA